MTSVLRVLLMHRPFSGWLLRDEPDQRGVRRRFDVRGGGGGCAGPLGATPACLGKPEPDGRNSSGGGHHFSSSRLWRLIAAVYVVTQPPQFCCR